MPSYHHHHPSPSSRPQYGCMPIFGPPTSHGAFWVAAKIMLWLRHSQAQAITHPLSLTLMLTFLSLSGYSSGCKSNNTKPPVPPPSPPVNPQHGARPPGEWTPVENKNLFFEIPCDVLLSTEELTEAGQTCTHICNIQNTKGNNFNCGTLCANPNQNHCRLAGEPVPTHTTPTTPPPIEAPPAPSPRPQPQPVEPEEPERPEGPDAEVQAFFNTPNPCGSGDGYLCVVSTMILKTYIPRRGDDKKIMFRKNLGTSIKYRVHNIRGMVFRDTNQYDQFRLKISSTVHREAHRNGFRFFVFSYVADSIFYADTPNVIFSPAVHPIGIEHATQHYDVKIGILERQRTRCRYKMIFYEKGTQNVTAYLSGIAGCYKGL